MLFKIISMNSNTVKGILSLEKAVNDFIKNKKIITFNITTIPWKEEIAAGSYTHVFISYEDN